MRRKRRGALRNARVVCSPQLAVAAVPGQQRVCRVARNGKVQVKGGMLCSKSIGCATGEVPSARGGMVLFCLVPQ